MCTRSSAYKYIKHQNDCLQLVGHDNWPRWLHLNNVSTYNVSFVMFKGEVWENFTHLVGCEKYSKGLNRGNVWSYSYYYVIVLIICS